MSLSPPPTNPSVVTTTNIADLALREYLFGNQMNPQDKGIIGMLENRVNTLIRWIVATFFVMLTAIATLVVDLMVRTGSLHG